MWRLAAILGFVLIAACSGDTPDPGAQGQECVTSVQVFLDTTATEQRERRVGELIEDAPGVLDSVFHSRDEAYREFRKQYREEPDIYEAKKPSDFPARYEVTLGAGQAISDFERALTGATTGIDRMVPGGCAEGPR